MALSIIFLIFILFGLVWMILTNPAHKTASFLVNGGPLILVAVGSLLTILRRGVVGIPLIILGISWWRRNRPVRPAGSSGGKKSTVRSAGIEMELDHDTGEMDGRVLQGRLEGARLSSLSLDELLSLYREISSDADSGALLESFLDRYHADWRDHVDVDPFRKQNGASGVNGMTRQEAYLILGLKPGASPHEIHQAWRHLIKGVHPDSGGSAFLTAKINAAKEVLLG